jgi:hypothetical protein
MTGKELQRNGIRTVSASTTTQLPFCNSSHGRSVPGPHVVDPPVPVAWQPVPRILPIKRHFQAGLIELVPSGPSRKPDGNADASLHCVGPDTHRREDVLESGHDHGATNCKAIGDPSSMQFGAQFVTDCTFGCEDLLSKQTVVIIS